MKQISSMTIGTVQLGMNYGIANMGGKPDENQSFSMLSTAFEHGVTSLDTARSYGNSEEVIGRFLRTWKGDVPHITTKIKFPEKEVEDVEGYVFSEVKKSLQNLGVERVNVVMLHLPGDLKQYGAKVVTAMEKLVLQGLTDQIGVSVYVADEVEEMLKYPQFSATQVPMSVFDQRLIVDGTIEKLREKNYTVFVRSVFLQGLFFLEPDKIDDPILVRHAVPKIRMIREIAKEEQMSVAQLAIAFIRDLPGVTSLVLGADTPKQVLDNIDGLRTPPISEKGMQRLTKEFAKVNIPEIMKVLTRPKPQS